ncbi:hypothetical protein SIN8267_01495 [Sinobacterium norvegicum]|uniref:Uncharacterized protein n=1 Tax=Sinobacterium norvegicum TaxID=1641715 RepID=A0ABN8EMR7_9GAMM|nr:hypothetical protein [Sinobacterium norvegicum]CAH0991391.1 hypothetical protein SIN8267_01495 [Sinobacterium norvegicum]
MPTPTATERQMAVREAIRMRESEEDPYYLAKTMLNQDLSLKKLMIVLDKAETLLEASDSEDEINTELAAAIATVYRVINNTGKTTSGAAKA